MGNRFTIHANPGLKHQVEMAKALDKGFASHNVQSIITSNRFEAGDVHVVLGPWYALDNWRHGDTLYIDRAYWGDPDCVSMHWLKHGEKIRTQNDVPRPYPLPAQYKEGGRSVYLCDYGCDPDGGVYDAVRKHPAECDRGPLSSVLSEYDVAYGNRTTALVDAAIAGLVVITEDRHSPVWPLQGQQRTREQWLNDLSWHNWNIDEIGSGEAWEYLQR